MMASILPIVALTAFLGFSFGDDEGELEKQNFVAALEELGANSADAACRYDRLKTSDLFPPSPKIRQTYIDNALNERPVLDGIDKESAALLGNLLAGCQRLK